MDNQPECRHNVSDGELGPKRSGLMKQARTAEKDPLRPEVMAVIRSSFDGYNEPDGKGAPSKPAPKKPAKTSLR
jgi:hypothetical protein